MKPRSEWGPADELAYGAKLAIGCLLLFSFGYGAADAIAYRIKQHIESAEWNQRGYIKCVDGHIEIGNFDVEGIDTSSMPVFDYNKLRCDH